jgi:SAM-dependent methyltransferase
MLDEANWAVLACPACRESLRRSERSATCPSCSADYPIHGSQVDLHLRAPKTVEFPLTVRPFGDSDPRYRRRPAPMSRNPRGAVDYDPYSSDAGLWYGNGVTRELASWMPSGDSGEIVLDLGCGNRRVEPVLRMTGMSYLGLDVAGAEPDVLGSGEALPIADDSIDFVFSLAVLPHIPRPWLACREIARVLKPGSLFIGTAQFLEPCDMQSRHHPSLLGLLDWLEEADLEILELEANDRWSGVRAISEMGYYPRRFRGSRAIATLMEGAHKAYRAARPQRSEAALGEGLPERYTGGFRFVVRRPA